MRKNPKKSPVKIINRPPCSSSVCLTYIFEKNQKMSKNGEATAKTGNPTIANTTIMIIGIAMMTIRKMPMYSMAVPNKRRNAVQQSVFYKLQGPISPSFVEVHVVFAFPSTHVIVPEEFIVPIGFLVADKVPFRMYIFTSA